MGAKVHSPLFSCVNWDHENSCRFVASAIKILEGIVSSFLIQLIFKFLTLLPAEFKNA